VPGRQLFVGRGAERQELLGLVGAASAGMPGVALLCAEAGAGKTRLLDEVVAALPAGTLVGRGAGVGFLGGRIPYAPLVAAVRSLLAGLGPRERAQVLGPDPKDLARLLPELGPTGDAASDQARLIAAVSLLLDRAAGLRTTVLVLDDLHCADVATLEVVAYVCAALDRQRLAILVAYRPDEVTDTLAEWLGDRRHDPDVTEVNLAPLSPEETREQLASLVAAEPGATLPEPVLDRIRARSGGNPYAAEALLRAALAGDTDAIPAPLRDVLVRRTRACAPDTSALLRIVAVAGQRVRPLVLRAVAERSGSPADLDVCVDEAVAAHLLAVEPDGDVRLRHDLLAEALYSDLRPRERRALHGLLADALEQVDPRPAVLAEQADRAGDVPRALRWSVRAADAAEAVYAYDAAHQQYERVRRLWPLVAGAADVAGADAVDVFSRAAAVAALCDHDTAAVEIIEQVRGWLLADPRTDPLRLGELEARYARLLLDDGRLDDALVAARRALDLVPPDPPTSLRAAVVSGLVHALDWAGGSDEWRPLAAEAVEVARATGDEEALARALVIRSTIEPTGHTTLADAREAVRLALSAGTPELVGQAYSNVVDCLQWAGLGRAGVDAATEGVAAVSARGLGIRYGTWLATQAADICITYGWWGEADELLQDALRRTRHVRGANRDYALVNRARLSALRGDWDALATDVDAMGPIPPVLELLRCEALAGSALARGDPERALRLVADLARGLTDRLAAMSGWLAWLGARALGDLAEGASRGSVPAQAGGAKRRGDADAVQALVETATGPLAMPGSCPDQVGLLCSAELARRAGDRSAAPWAAAVDALEHVERPYLLAYGRWRLARALVANRESPAAAAPLRAAASAARLLGAAPLLADVEALARRARIDLRTPETTPDRETAGLPLSPRELEILSHLAAGRTNSEIAAALFISGKTASVHVSNILRKLGVASRYEAAELAERLGAR
jgi:DNA-binding CsgD family transcriptional regulator/tetratricopeptide (TPR) repeat protein